MNKLSIKDIAKMAGVAPSTVSSILNGKMEARRISEALAQKVLTIARQVGYTPNQVAVSLRTGSSKIIGLLVADIANSFYASLAGSIEEELKAHGYRVVYCSTKNDQANSAALLDMLAQRQVDGYILTPAEGILDALQSLREKGKPVILLDRYFPNYPFPYVGVDDRQGMYDGLEHLLQNGYKNIGLITLAEAQQAIRENAFNAFFQNKRSNNCVKKVLHIPANASPFETGQLITHFLQENPSLEALFFTNSQLCKQGIKSLLDLDLKIPAGMGVLCFDDHELFEFCPPGISAIRQPVELIGKTAVKQVLEQIGSKNKVAKNTAEWIPGELIPRGSTAPRSL
ncbi:MAG: LacI family transcriptional regulator [Chitinophagaceae bacterium]|nr:MAG: LacI family transcriptional regulator [Chitinophagaceae bacterium]